MSFDVQSFWYYSDEFPLDPGATEDELNTTEKVLGVELPESYKRLLRVSNGGTPNYSGVRLPYISKCRESHAIFIGGLYGTARLRKSSRIVEDWEMPKDLLLISGNCHHNIALRYRGKGSPAVVYYESDSEQLIELAADFDEFLAKLEPSE